MNMVQFTEDKQMLQLRNMREKQEEKMVRYMAGKKGIGYVDLSGVSINTDALKLIPEERAKVAQMAAFNMNGKKVAIAIASPLIPAVSEEVKALVDKKYEPTLFMASHKSLEKAWSRYGDISYAVETEAGVIDISSADIQDILDDVKSLQDAQKLLEVAIKSKKAYRVSKVIEVILYAAYALHASDIHIEPEEEKVRLRYRLDGILTNVLEFDHATYNRILSRIKLTAGLKLNIRENAQDGRFSIKLANTDIEIRTSTLPDSYGESIVMRLLDPRAIMVKLSELGMDQKLLERMQHEIDRPNGMILNTGPTGSGKSTTLFAFLRQILSPEIKIITIENPIEYHVPGITQTQVDRDEGYTFLSGLRAALRQDPDVIMVGEIRDEETAKIAANAALTGHLVLSTLHTNSAAGTFARMRDLGVTPETMSTSINVALAQRLVRRLCPECRKEVPSKDLSEYDKKMINNVLRGMDNPRAYIQQKDVVYEPVGCDACNGLGYSNRIGLFEAIFMDEELEELLKTTLSEKDIFKGTRRQGFLSLKEDAVVKLFNGTTSLEEIHRVVDLEV